MKKPAPKRPRRQMIPVYLDPDKKAALLELSRATRITQAEYLREAVDYVLTKYRRSLKGGAK